MKRLFLLFYVMLIASNSFAEPLKFAGLKWYELSGNSYYTTCKSIEELKKLGEIFDFNIEESSDIIRNLKGDAIKIEWDEYFENLYSEQVKNGNLDQGKYLVNILCDPEMAFFKMNGMSSMIQIIQVRDSSYSLLYKSKKIVELTIMVY